ncbi:hypothetical protein [Hymenobacter sedentarius]|uniref:hypothetical protein n=1 Tax=Hymenobacter sedentarius TaxID=1411621 RepID=UPI0012FDEA2A|nr:hypothetical protein [Hymenobacter sedentarius]
MRAFLGTNRIALPTRPDKAVVQYDSAAYIFVAADSATKAGAAIYCLVPVTRGVSEDGYIEVHLPAAPGLPLRFFH